MRCCALLKGILVLDEARMPALAGILARQHWEAWLVSLYVLLAGAWLLPRVTRSAPARRVFMQQRPA